MSRPKKLYFEDGTEAKPCIHNSIEPHWVRMTFQQIDAIFDAGGYIDEMGDPAYECQGTFGGDTFDPVEYAKKQIEHWGGQPWLKTSQPNAQ